MVSEPAPPSPPVIRAPNASGRPRQPRDPFRFLMELTRRSGPVAQYRAGTEPAYLVNHPDLIRLVLADHASRYSKETFINNMFKQAVADGLLTTEGSEWRRHRRLMQPAFHRERLLSLGQTMAAAVRDLLNRWESLADTGEVVDMAAEMGALTLRITALSLFGVDIADQANDLGLEITEGLKALAAPHKPEFQEPRRRLEELVTSIVEDRRTAKETATDLLSMLLDARDEDTGEAMTDRELRDEMITLLLAGYETTANALAWTWYLLARNPAALEALRAELDRELAGRLPTLADLPRLEYNRMVFDESLRLYPPAWILGRKALRDDTLGGQFIPAGSVVAVSPYTLHRHPDFWEDPERFDPTRFTKEREAARKSFVYIPFGGGPRLCIGHNFALLEGQLIVASVAGRFTTRLVTGHHVEPERIFVLRPRGGLPMTIDSVQRPA